ncbi:methionyl-tRNA formyltransferase [Tengunoibacter tsumagoiensis]|uniref:Formyl transferase N-terminal domain-containing protein n=1 Tax=Tengunoibacter tsumagoiensis TaxID=2014871 RepID=A0A402A0V5_9CHLR|nr:formyltransferase family protein [Tengunoibacter tsumagoiensis]GCE12689.1 hypothetical protein KTT_25480 [Tengunoibacter tsumagoiensis]
MNHNVSAIKPGNRPPRVLFFGMQSAFSSPSLYALLKSGIEVCAVILPATPFPGARHAAIKKRELPHRSHMMTMAGSLSIDDLILRHQLPAWDVYDLADAVTVQVLAEYQADLICVACFSQRIPREIIDLPPLGCLNVHPSILPANRGPVPLFWILRQGQEQGGVTVHFVSEKMDAGDIVAQDQFPLPEGIRFDPLEQLCAERGAALLVQSVWKLMQGTATRMPQDESRSSLQSFPQETDFVVHATEWDAPHVYRFIRGVSNWHRPLHVYVQKKRLYVYDAIAYSFEEQIGPDHPDEQGRITIPCRTGRVTVLTSPPASYQGVGTGS